MVLNSFTSLNQLSGHGYRIAYDVSSFQIWLCLLLLCDYTSNVVLEQTCHLSAMYPLPHTLELSVIETRATGSLKLSYKCKGNYTLVGESENDCLNGKWFLPPNYLPKCKQSCSQPLYPDITIAWECEVDTTSCHGLIEPNTIAHAYCSFGYRQPDVGFVDVIRCSEDGEWDFSMSRCEQICGLEEYEGIPSTRNTIVPWNVGIFNKNDDFTVFRLKCGGTILSAKIVISAAVCFLEGFTSNSNWYDLSQFKVVAGHYYQHSFPSSSNLKTQILNVAHRLFEANFALLVLVENIIFTPTIQPVCLDYNSTPTALASGLNAKLAVWDTNDDLLMTEMTTSGSIECFADSNQFKLPQKFCVFNRTNFCKFNQGAGLVLPKKIGKKTVYFLRGVAVADGECRVNSVFFDIHFDLDIILEQFNQIDRTDMKKLNDRFPTSPTVDASSSHPTFEQSSSSNPPVSESSRHTTFVQSSAHPPVEESSVIEGSCLIPANLSETIQVYYAAQPDLEITKGTYVDPFVDVIYKCKEKHAIIGTNFCLNGEWNVPNHPKCVKFCSPMNLPKVTTSATCEIDGETISCHQPLRPNTIARLTCAIGYRKSTDHFYDTLRCGDDGEWDYQPFGCEPICGIEAPYAVPYIVGGEVSNITKVPWHVGVFSDIHNKGRFGQICGGTILNAKVVISAAHCFWDTRDNQFYNESNFKVAAGKYYRDFYATEPIKPQILNVVHIHHKVEYSDYAGLYAFDIVLLVLDGYIVFKSYIKPICFETLLYNEKSVAPGLFGRVAGWGLESSGGKSSAVLKIIDLPAIDYHECKLKFSPEFRPFITPDKFCAGFTDGRSVCEGDSGGGLVFPKMIGANSIYYLRGIVSTGNNKAGSCDNDKYTVFTNIQYHIDMITYIESVNRPK